MARFVGKSFVLESGKALTLYTCPEGASAALGGVRIVNAGEVTSLVPETEGAETTPGDAAFSVGLVRAGGEDTAPYWLAGNGAAGEPIALGERPAPVGAGVFLGAGDQVVALAFGHGLVAHLSVTEATS